MNRKIRRDYSKKTAKDSHSSRETKELEAFFLGIGRQLSLRYGIAFPEVMSAAKGDALVPDTAFIRGVGILEAVVKYLKEQQGLPNRRIARLTGRDSRSVWQAYSKASKKHPGKLALGSAKAYIPVSVLRKKGSGVLEAVAEYMKDSLGMTYHEIAVSLKRDDRTIWTAYNRRRRKDGSKS